MANEKEISISLQESTGQLDFINALSVQVASIGTVSNSFVLFLFLRNRLSLINQKVYFYCLLRFVYCWRINWLVHID